MQGRRLLSGLAAITLVFAGAGALPEGTFEALHIKASAEDIGSGTCGESCTWTLDSSGVLTISGTGDMKDYIFSGGDVVPWASLKNDIKSVVIENGVTSIGERAFRDCSSIQSVSIPASVKVIGKEAFWGCEKLGAVTIPNSVTSIKDGAFYLTDLKTVTVPDSVTELGEEVFESCFSLKSAVLPDSITYISDYLFRGCSSLESIEIPESVTYIGREAFRYCEKLRSAEIPGSVKRIGDSAFRDCSGLKSVTIPEGVETIDNYAFKNCIALKSIAIPESATALGTQPFGVDEENNNIADFTLCCYRDRPADIYGKARGFKIVYLSDEIVYGDANHDGKVDLNDLGLLQQYIAEWELPYIDLRAADVNLDGYVNFNDLGLLQQYLCNWDVKLGTKQ